jgi:hypothetical protein
MRRESQVGFQQPLEFQERLVVEDDVIDILQGNPRFGQAVLDRVAREARIMLLA